jgi:hypothetical protein
VHARLDVGDRLTVSEGGQLLAVYRFGGVPKPYFHPVLLGDGSESSLTLACPHDHLHHRGLWFAWKFINGENFWEEAPVCHRVVTRDLQLDQEVRDRVRWISHLEWQLAPGVTLLHEHRTLAIGRPRFDPYHRWYPIDFDLMFRPDEREVVLSLLTVKEQPWGGYAGLAYRPARGMDARWQLLTSNGPATSSDKGIPARWADYSGGLDGGPWSGGLAIFDHPGNLRHPPPFFVLSPPGFGFLNPSPLFHEAFILRAGDSLRLRYRVIVHSGLGEAGWIEELYQQWLQEVDDAKEAKIPR